MTLQANVSHLNGSARIEGVATRCSLHPNTVHWLPYAQEPILIGFETTRAVCAYRLFTHQPSCFFYLFLC
jgi:hypothetical protein